VLVAAARGVQKRGHQIDVGSDLRLEFQGLVPEGAGDAAEEVATFVRGGGDHRIGAGAPAWLAADVAVEAPAEFPPVPASERVQPLSVASGDGVAALPVGEPPRFRQFTGVERLSNESLPDDRLEIFRDASSEIVDGAASNDVSHGSHIRVTPMGHSWRREPVVLKGFL